VAAIDTVLDVFVGLWAQVASNLGSITLKDVVVMAFAAVIGLVISDGPVCDNAF
jgi:hypothetical protein